MKIIIDSKLLTEKLTPLAGLVSRNPTLPVLETALFNASSGKLFVVVSDMETTVVTEIEKANVQENGAACIPIGIVLNTIKTLVQQDICIEDVENKIKITTLSGEYSIPYYNAEDYPRTPTVTFKNSIKLNAEQLIGGISKTLFCASSDSLRPAMTGVLLEVSDGFINMVATDAHRLASYSIEYTGEDQALIIPSKAAKFLKTFVRGDVNIDMGGNHAKFTCGTDTVVVRVIDQKFPNYKVVVPKSNDKEAHFGKSDLLNMIKRAMLYTNENTHQVQIEINNSKAQIGGSDIDTNKESKESCPCITNIQDKFVFAFNAKMFSEIISSIEDTDIRITFSEPNKASLIFGEKDDNYFYLLMPVMIV